MSISFLYDTKLYFTTDGSNVQTGLESSANTLTFVANTATPSDPVNLENALSLNIINSGVGSTKLSSASATSNMPFVLPATQGTSGQLLSNDGSGNLSWTTSSTALASGSVGDIQYAGVGNTFNSATAEGDTTYFNFTASSGNGTLLVGSTSTASGKGTFTIQGSTDNVGSLGGSDISIISGNGPAIGPGTGGTVTLQGGSGPTGNGGAIDIISGSSTGSAGTGGAISITAGDGHDTASGGDITITTGVGGITDGKGGDINLVPSPGSGIGASGIVTISTTANSGLYMTNSTGNNIITTPVVTSIADSENIYIAPGNTTGGGNAGLVYLSGGFAGGSAGNGGNATFQGGTSQTGNGGNVTISGGTTLSTTGGNAGSITISAGDGFNSGAGNAGSITIRAGSTLAGSGVGGDLTITSGSTASTTGRPLTLVTGEGTTTSGDLVVNIGTNASTTSGVFLVRSGNNDNTNVGFKYTSYDTTEIVTIKNGTVSATDVSTGTLVVNGGAGFNGACYATSFTAVSDVMYKKDIKRIDKSLDKLMLIEGYTYKWKNDNWNGGQEQQWGLLAQQLESIGLGDMVTSNGKSKGVNYNNFIPLIIEAIKDLSVKLDTILEAL